MIFTHKIKTTPNHFLLSNKVIHKLVLNYKEKRSGR
jgi:hypothetical protein